LTECDCIHCATIRRAIAEDGGLAYNFPIVVNIEDGLDPRISMANTAFVLGPPSRPVLMTNIMDCRKCGGGPGECRCHDYDPENPLDDLSGGFEFL
jgi:hypothetical protein